MYKIFKRKIPLNQWKTFLKNSLFFSKVNRIVTDISIEVQCNMSKRKMYNTTIDADLIKEIKILAAQLDKRQNDILEEAIQDLLEKYKSKDEETPSLGVSNG